MFTLLRSLFAPRAALVAENLALRQQLALLRRSRPRPRPTRLDRAFWIALSRAWSGWHKALAVVRPATVVKWHRAGFRALWRWRSRPKGRAPKHPGLRRLVRRLAHENVTWGAPRIHGELRKLGIDVSESTVARLMPRRSTPPSATWKTFLRTHLPDAAATDMFVVPTATFRQVYALVVLHHGRRRIVHTNVTEHPTAAWVLQQLREAFPDETAPRFLHRDRDATFQSLTEAIENLGIEQVVSAPRSPWQNPYVERVIGTIRRDLFDHVIVLGEDHARRLLNEYVRYYNESRTHLALEKDSPSPREVDAAGRGSSAFPTSVDCIIDTSGARRSRHSRHDSDHSGLVAAWPGGGALGATYPMTRLS